MLVSMRLTDDLTHPNTKGSTMHAILVLVPQARRLAHTPPLKFSDTGHHRHTRSAHLP